MGLQGNNPGTYFAFSMIVILSFLGNMSVLGVMAIKRGALQKPYNIFICSLSCTDIITAMFLIFSRYLYLPSMPENDFAATLFCSTIWNACILFGLGYVSIYTCLVLTFERWLAVVKPNVYRKMKPKHAFAVVAAVWFWGLLIQATTLFRAKPDFELGLKHLCVSESLANKQARKHCFPSLVSQVETLFPKRGISEGNIVSQPCFLQVTNILSCQSFLNLDTRKSISQLCFLKADKPGNIVS